MPAKKSKTLKEVAATPIEEVRPKAETDPSPTTTADEEPPVPADAGTPEAVKEKKKRKKSSSKKPANPAKKRKKIANPLTLRDESATPFQMKKKIHEWKKEGKKINIPSHLRKPIRSIKGHSSTLDDPELLQDLDALYRKCLELEAVEWIAEVLLYYEDQHNIEILKRDQHIIERAHARPTRVTFVKMLQLYNHYLCDLEDKHGYYAIYKKTDVKAKDKQKREKMQTDAPAVKKLAKAQPYNLFIQEQWILRRPEFNEIASKTSVSEVMRLLSVEWKANTKLEEEYKLKCNELNQKRKEDAEAKSLPEVVQTPPLELAM